MKCRHITGQQCRRIPLGIDGDEQYLQPIGVGPQLLHYPGHFGERRRADIGTLRETKKNQHDFAFEVGQGARRAGVVGETEAFAVVKPGDIGIGKYDLGSRGSFVAAGHKCQRQRQ